MYYKKFRSVLAKVLIVMIMMPNLTIRAETNDSNNAIQEQVMSETVNKVNNAENLEDNALKQEIENETTLLDGSVEQEQIAENEDEIKVSDNLEIENKTETIVESDEIKNNEESLERNFDSIKESLVGEAYTSKKVIMPTLENNYEYLSDRIEYKLKMEALSTMTVLETKTDSKYEIALAHKDGSFTYVSSVESVEEAMSEVETLSENFEEDPQGTVDDLSSMSLENSSAALKSLSESTSNDTVLPAVINSSGQVVYSANSMARILKHIDGQPYYGIDKITYLYSDATLTKQDGYINHMYVDDAPILQDNGTSAKILVSGKEGWINKDTSKSEYDMIVVPMNQVINPSYYMVKDGELKHFISYDLRGSSGYTITIGKAPSYLAEGIKYLSYDGIYFYNGQDIQSGLNTLINDYKSGTNLNAVNATNPFYIYYKYLPFRSKTVYTANELDKFINDNTESSSKLRGIGSALKSAEETYGVNAILALGVAINESDWGRSSIAQSKNNLFGLDAVDSNSGQAADVYSSPSASITDFSKNYISKGYADPANNNYFGGFLGNKNNGTNVKYASDPFWGEKASQHAFAIDKYLSGSVSNLKDTDLYQLAMATVNNKVMKSDGTLLYDITNDKSQYAAYVETPFIITKISKVTVAGQSTYEINPERTTELNAGGSANEFSGYYDWSVKGYVVDSGIKFLNEANQSTELSVLYQGHVQNIGWQSYVRDGELSGTEGQSLRVEGFKIKLENAPAGLKIKYKTHVQNIGWQDWVYDGAMAGTEGQALRVEALQIMLEGTDADKYSVQYQAHVQNEGWQPWVSDGEISGSFGKCQRIEALRVKIVKIQTVAYQGHVQNIGWQSFVKNGALAGTEGQALRVEGFKIKLENAPEGLKIKYKTHVQNIGWQDWVYDGAMAGTEGQALRVEALQIMLEGTDADKYTVQYQSHVQNEGWQPWVSDGQISGSFGKSQRIEALRIKIVKK